MELYLISEWILRLGMIPLVAHRRRLTSALSWLALIFFLPWLGVLLYLLFAERPLTRRTRRHREIQDAVRSGERLRFQERHRVELRLQRERAALGALTHRLGGFEVLGGNRAEILPGDDRAIEALVASIDGAEHHVHVLFYIIADDRSGRAVADALTRAAARGVTCRLLADAIGSRRFHRRMAPRLREAGVAVHKVLSLPFLARKLRPLDLRNHRKLVVVDGTLAYTGSMNLVDFDQQSSDEIPPWRDVVVRVTGPAVHQLQVVFEEDWRFNVGEELPEEGLFPGLEATGDVPLQVVPSGPTDRVETIHNLLVAAINGARERIVITTPYLIPDEPTRVALKLAALRGVRVQVVVPHRSDSRVVQLASNSYVAEMMEDGVEVHEHTNGFLHAKTVTVDHDLAVIGSANFDRRSFHLNFELNLLLYGDEAVDQVVAMQDHYLRDCSVVDAEAWRARPALRRLAEDVVRLMSPLL